MKKIPPKNSDLRRYALWKDGKRLIGFILWCGVLIASAYFYNANHQTYPPHRLLLGWRLVIWVLATLISGLLIFKLWRIFGARATVGTVIDTGISRTYSTSNDPKGSPHYAFRFNTYLKVQTDHGKTRWMRFEQKDGFYQYYHEGNRIVRFHGLPYPTNLDPDAPCGYVCSACGRWRRDLADRCDGCNHSLIDPKDL